MAKSKGKKSSKQLERDLARALHNIEEIRADLAKQEAKLAELLAQAEHVGKEPSTDGVPAGVAPRDSSAVESAHPKPPARRRAAKAPAEPSQEE